MKKTSITPTLVWIGLAGLAGVVLYEVVKPAASSAAPLPGPLPVPPGPNPGPLPPVPNPQPTVLPGAVVQVGDEVELSPTAGGLIPPTGLPAGASVRSVILLVSSVTPTDVSGTFTAFTFEVPGQQSSGIVSLPGLPSPSPIPRTSIQSVSRNGVRIA